MIENVYISVESAILYTDFYFYFFICDYTFAILLRQIYLYYPVDRNLFKVNKNNAHLKFISYYVVDFEQVLAHWVNVI